MSQSTKYFIANWGVLGLCGFAFGSFGIFGLIPAMAMGWYWQDICAIITAGPGDEADDESSEEPE